MNINVLFFSNHCEGSQILLSMLQGEKLLRFFKQICTDNNPHLPPEIRVTPTLFIRGIPKPYVAGEAFAWFQKIKQWKNDTVRQRVVNTQRQQMGFDENPDSTQIYGFSKDEMSGMSDMFACIESDTPLSHAHFDYTKMGTEHDRIFYVGIKKDGEEKISESEQKNLSIKLILERQQADATIKKQIDEFQRSYKK
jgi:hypothetical protein